MNNNTVNTDLIRGHVDTIILNSLMERDRYGYEILDLIDNLSEGRYVIKQPTLYSCLKRLEKQGFISSYYGDENEETSGGRRRYYKLTQKGIDTLTQDQREWEFSRTIVDRLLSDKQIDLKTADAPFDPSELRPLTKRVKAYDYEEAEPQPQQTYTVQQPETTAPVVINFFGNQIPPEESIIQPGVSKKSALEAMFSPIKTEPIQQAEPVKQTDPALLEEEKVEDKPVIEDKPTAVVEEKFEEPFAEKQEDSDDNRPFSPIFAKIFGTSHDTDKSESGRGTSESEKVEREVIDEDPQVIASRERARAILYSPLSSPVEPIREEEPKDVPKAVAQPIHQETEEERFLREELERKRLKSMQELKIGDYAEPMKPILNEEEIAYVPKDTYFNVPKPPVQVPVFEEKKSLPYRDKFDDLYESSISAPIKQSDVASVAATTATDAEFVDGTVKRHLQDMKHSLAEDGYRMRIYNKTNASQYYYGNYIYANKLLRDSGIILFILLGIEVLIALILKNAAHLSAKFLCGSLGIGLLVPIIPTFMWLSNPTKRTKAKFVFRQAIFSSTIILIFVVAIITVIFLVAPDLNGFSNPHIYMCYVYAIDIPLCVVIYQLLYRSSRYHLKR